MKNNLASVSLLTLSHLAFVCVLAVALATIIGFDRTYVDDVGASCAHFTWISDREFDLCTNATSASTPLTQNEGE